MSLDLDTMRRDTLQELEDTLAEARRLITEASSLERASHCHQATVSLQRTQARRLIDQADQLLKRLQALGLGA